MAENFEPLEGMKMYCMGFISHGPAWTPEQTPQVKSLQEQHLANINSLTHNGNMVLADPFLDDRKLLDYFLFKTGYLESVKRLAQNEPTVKAGRLIVDVYPWMIPLGILP